MRPAQQARVWVYIASLVALTAGVVLTLPPSMPDDLWLLPGLAALVAAAEMLQVRFRIGSQIDGSNLVEAVLTPLLVFSPSPAGVAAVAVGQLVAGALRRNEPVKLVFNVVQWSLAAAVGMRVWLATPGPDPASWGGASTLVLAVLAIGAVNVVAFWGVLLLTGSRFRQLVAVLGRSWSIGLAVNIALGMLFALANEASRLALLLVPVPLVVLHLAYRGLAEARADRSRLAGMHRAAAVLAGPLDPRPVIPEFLRATAELFDSRRATLVLRSDEGREIHRVDLETGGFTVSLEPEDTASLEAALTAHPGAIRITASEETAFGNALRAAGHRDCLAAPMLDGGRVLGALVLLDQRGLEGGAAGQLSVLEALAREVIAALTKGRLLDSVLEERRKLATVVGATSDGIASIDEDGAVRSWNPALEQITGMSERAVQGRADALARLDPRTPSGEPVPLADWTTWGELPAELTVRRAGGGRRRLACSWSQADEGEGRLLVLVARDVTPVQEFEALRAEFGRLVEQEAARRLVVEQLQAAVVPDTPTVEGLELAVNYVASDPKEPTGGDLWDWHVLPSGELHLAVVDVLGHGVAATKSALAVVHTLRSLALDETPLTDIVGRAAGLLERQDAELVATVVLGRLDPRTGCLRIVSGGHPPALIASADGTVRQATTTGGAIGWPGAGSDGEESLVLGPGDTLLLYTDGLVEARKDIVEGLDSLARDLASVAALPVTAMTDELVRRALAGADRRDDTLALVVRRAGVPVLASPVPRPGTWEIAPDRHAVPQVRREAVRWLADKGLEVGDVALVIAELLANAVRAARSAVTLSLLPGPAGVHVTVTDDGPGLSELPEDGVPDLDAEGSRGLFLVRKLALGLELVPTETGTTVRCLLPLDDPYPNEVPLPTPRVDGKVLPFAAAASEGEEVSIDG